MRQRRLRTGNRPGRWWVEGLPPDFEALIKETTRWQQHLGSSRSWSYRVTLYGHHGRRFPGGVVVLRSPEDLPSKKAALSWIDERIGEALALSSRDARRQRGRR